MIEDVTMQALGASLTGLSDRQRAIADNIANVNTPGYRAKKVEFEDSLRSAIQTGDPSAAQAVTQTSLEPTNINGNNVNLDEAMVSLTDTGLRYSLDIQALNNKFSMLRTAIGEGA